MSTSLNRLNVSVLALGAILSFLAVPAQSAHACEANTSNATASPGCPSVSGENETDRVRLDALLQRRAQNEQPGGSAGSGEAASEAERRYWEAVWKREFATPGCAARMDCSPFTRPKKPGTSTPPPPQSPQVTLRDIASFIPDAPTALAEPDGFGFLGRPVNFVMSAKQHVISGTLLGFRAEVRFTPVSSRWRHSDGGVVVADTLGASWAQLGQSPLSPTATSYVYRARGNVTVHPTLGYSAEYRVAGGGWTAIRGLVYAAAADIALQIYSAQSVLVERSCTEDPNGPGC